MYVSQHGLKHLGSKPALLAVCLWAGAWSCGQPLADDLGSGLGVIQAEVLDVACVHCHNTEFSAGELDLSDETITYQALVGVTATNRVAHENGWLLVDPGSPSTSFLMRKLRMPGVGEGAPMPPGSHELTDRYVELVEDWIESLAVDEVAL